GVYGVLFGICVHILLYSRRAPGMTFNLPLLVTAVLMFSMCTIHVSVGLVRGLRAFIDQENIQDGALDYYSAIWLWINIFKQALFATNNIVADGLVIYRCYIVWGSNIRVIIVPSIMLLATSVCAYAAVYNFIKIVPGQDVFATNIAEWGTALFILSLTTNILVTSLIGQLIRILQQLLFLRCKTHSHKYISAVAIIIESGAIYSLSLITLLTLYCLRTNAQYIAYDAHSQIMGIVPTLIIVRVGLGISTEDAATMQSAANKSLTNSTRVALNRAAHVQVRTQVQRMVHVDGETVDNGIEDSEGPGKYSGLYSNPSFGNV
ncbi:hypothetical protein B0H11DRAFT_1725913, partial [Mycena galericulata]